MDNVELQEKFSKSLQDLYEVYQKSEPKQSLPYGKPMFLKPVTSSVDYFANPSRPDKTASPKSLEVLLSIYGGLKQEFKSLATEINRLNNLEQIKKEYVKKRDAVRQQTFLTDFEKLNKEKELKNSLKKVKDGIKEISIRIDKSMDTVNEKLFDLSKLKKSFERKHLELNKVLNALKRGELSVHALQQKGKPMDIDKMLSYNRQFVDGIRLCEQMLIVAKERKESLNRSMWMETPVVDKTLFENIDGITKVVPSKKVERGFFK